MATRHQVFVSSTYSDLMDERRAVTQALLAIDCFPAGMEIFPAAGNGTWPLIEAMIAESDYYVLVIGGRYGLTARDNPLSFTHREYRLAIEKKIPVLAFLQGNPGKIPQEKVDLTRAARQALEDFRKEVTLMHHVDFFRNQDELALKVTQAVRHAVATEPRPGWVRASPTGDDRSGQARSEVVRLYERDDLAGTIGSVRARLQRARKTLNISGNDCKLIESNKRHIKEALARGVQVNVLCVGPSLFSSRNALAN